MSSKPNFSATNFGLGRREGHGTGTSGSAHRNHGRSGSNRVNSPSTLDYPASQPHARAPRVSQLPHRIHRGQCGHHTIHLPRRQFRHFLITSEPNEIVAPLAIDRVPRTNVTRGNCGGAAPFLRFSDGRKNDLARSRAPDQNTLHFLSSRESPLCPLSGRYR